MTLDDLRKTFERAVAKAAPFPQHHEDGICEGVRAVVEALRDELYAIAAKDYDNWWLDGWVRDRFDEILASDGVEVAGGVAVCGSDTAGKVENVHTVNLPNSGADIPAPATAPVCEWGKQDNGFEHTTSCGLLTRYKPLPSSHCHICGKPIKFKETAHGA
jgi:hypothetical protein